MLRNERCDETGKIAVIRTGEAVVVPVHLRTEIPDAVNIFVRAVLFQQGIPCLVPLLPFVKRVHPPFLHKCSFAVVSIDEMDPDLPSVAVSKRLEGAIFLSFHRGFNGFILRPLHGRRIDDFAVIVLSTHEPIGWVGVIQFLIVLVCHKIDRPLFCLRGRANLSGEPVSTYWSPAADFSASRFR